MGGSFALPRAGVGLPLRNPSGRSPCCTHSCALLAVNPVLRGEMLRTVGLGRHVCVHHRRPPRRVAIEVVLVDASRVERRLSDGGAASSASALATALRTLLGAAVLVEQLPHDGDHERTDQRSDHAGRLERQTVAGAEPAPDAGGARITAQIHTSNIAKKVSAYCLQHVPSTSQML